MDRIPIVDVIIEREGKLLMHRRTFWPEGKLDFPGGHVEPEESVEQAAIRETKEETGLDVKLVSKLGVFDYYDRGDKATHFFIGEVIGGNLQDSNEGKLVWVDPKGITEEDLAFPQVHLKVLETFLKSKNDI